MPKKRIALICNDKVGKSMAGPGIRYFEMAKVLSRNYDVILLVPESSDLAGNHPEINFRTYDSSKSTSTIFPNLSGCDYVVAQSLRPFLLWKVKRAGIKFIADLYDPLIIEVMEYLKYDRPAYRNIVYNFQFYLLLLQLSASDHILCASERQRELYLDLMAQYGIKKLSWQNGLDLDSTISLLPFGFPKENPKPSNIRIIEERFPQIKKSDFVLYWGGGVWNWFDPLSVIKSVEKIAKRRNDIKLFFLGMRHPNPKVKEMEMAAKSLEYTKDKNLLDESVFFNFDWTPYQKRVGFLCRTDACVSTHFDNIETFFSFRTRILDYLWAEKPMILTKGDCLAEFVEENQLGIVVDYEKPDEIEAAILKLANDKKLSEKFRKNIAAVKSEFIWDNLLTKLALLIEEDKIPIIKIKKGQFHSYSSKFYYYGLLKKMYPKKSG